jgi:TRAP transporter 4TM/12TM fusion protein
VANRVKRNKTGIPPTAQQDIDVRQTVAGIESQPVKSSPTDVGKVDEDIDTEQEAIDRLEEAAMTAEAIETGIATEGTTAPSRRRRGKRSKAKRGAEAAGNPPAGQTGAGVEDGDAASGEEDEIDAEAVMRKYDRESNTRIWEGTPKRVIQIFMALFSVYCIGMTLFSTTLPEVRLSLFLGFIVVIGYLIYPANKKKVRTNYIPWYDVALMVVGAACFFYFAVNATDIIKLATRIQPIHVVIGVVGILVVGELCRRCVGLPIMFVVAALIIYAFYFFLARNPDFYSALRSIIYRMFYTTSGIIGTPINVCYTYIVLFIIFGAFLERTGIAGFFIALANRIAGWASGGAAKVSVISSALCGMVSGSSVGNTVTTGSVTIPMMKKTGFRPEFAGAVEAASSTGGQIMPPIMGAAAFLMAEYMGIPYITVAAKAIVPAMLYFTGVFLTVHLEAKRMGLKGIPRSELPRWSYLAKNCYLILPLVLLVWLVASGARTMAWSAAISIIGALVVGFINFLVMNMRNREQGTSVASVFGETVKVSLLTAYDALIAGARSCVSVAVACAMAGMIAGCITVTGLAGTLINAIVNAAGSAVILGLVLTMLCCIVLGMGVPTTANYCIMAATCAPILIQLGIPMVSAHFFVFYFGIVADITPPVALAAYAASAIAKSRPMRTALNASKLAIAAFIIPYIFAFNPIMLLEGSFAWYQLVGVICTAIFGLFGVAVALNGNLYRKVPAVMRVLFAAGGLALIDPETITDVIGLVTLIVLTLIMRTWSKREGSFGGRLATSAEAQAQAAPQVALTSGDAAALGDGEGSANLVEQTQAQALDAKLRERDAEAVAADAGSPDGKGGR